MQSTHERSQGFAASNAVKRVCRRRASQRWSAWLTQTKSRIGFKNGMRDRLGPKNWRAFVRFAEQEYKEDFVCAFLPASGELCCEGKLDGEPCPKQLKMDLVNMSSIHCEEELPKLHLDHTFDLEHVCDVWSAALPAEPNAWDDGICGPLVAHLLFSTKDKVVGDGVHWRRQLAFRCGAVRGVQGQRAKDFCHDQNHPHDRYRLTVGHLQTM